MYGYKHQNENIDSENIAMRSLLFFVVFFTTVNSQAGDTALTKGRAVTEIENLYECGSPYRKSGIGHVIDQHQRRWIGKRI